MAGHLVSLGWEVYLLDVYTGLKRPGVIKQSGNVAFRHLLESIRSALDAIGSDVVAAGHGLGGLLALKSAERSRVRAAVALGPLIPGFHSPLLHRYRAGWFSLWEKPWLPSRRRMLELFSEAETFQRQALIRALTPMDTSAAEHVASGGVEFAPNPTPRMIIAGEADGFAPAHKAAEFAAKIDAQFIGLPGRGHWLVGGRALERIIAHMQRFLVQAVGEELLLLYEKEPNGSDAEQ
ncbi:MAG: alpha/beta fold hydrolase [Deltaproteobacteria bacterium]|nr:alpha/beta fold hydrolase [Deltaproteobacteria bacterium]